VNTRVVRSAGGEVLQRKLADTHQIRTELDSPCKSSFSFAQLLADILSVASGDMVVRALSQHGSGNLTTAGWSSVTDRKPYRHRFPRSIIQYALWLYHHSSLSQRGIQEVLQERGSQVNHETLRQWNIKFAPLLAKELRHREPRRGSRWFLDEVCLELRGRNFWLFLARTAPMRTLGCWRAVDDSGAVLDLLLQARRDT